MNGHGQLLIVHALIIIQLPLGQQLLKGSTVVKIHHDFIFLKYKICVLNGKI